MNLNISSELKIYEKSKPKNRFKEIKEKKKTWNGNVAKGKKIQRVI